MIDRPNYHSTGRYIPRDGGSRSRLMLNGDDRIVPGDPNCRYTYSGFLEDVVLEHRVTTLTGHHDRVPRIMGLFDRIGGQAFRTREELHAHFHQQSFRVKTKV